MHVDRSRFLFLTASLAAAACNQPQPAASPDSGGVDPARSGNTADPEPSASPNPGGSAVWLEIEPGTEDKPPQAADPNCDNQAGTPAACKLSAPAGHCESLAWSQTVCEAFPRFLQPRAAEAAVDCMLAANGTTRVCDWMLVTECTGAGVQASCIDPATRTECDAISSSCGGSLDVFTCQQAMSSVRPRHVPALASCVREFCEVGFCVTDLAHL
ncbi:MAG: hypothetical protein R6X02_25785 [Enhygromyxa sp.]